MSNYLKLINDTIINEFELKEENMETYLNNPSKFDKSKWMITTWSNNEIIALDFNTKIPFDDSAQSCTYKFYNVSKFAKKILINVNFYLFDFYDRVLNSSDIFDICIRIYKIRNNDRSICKNMFGIYYDVLNNAIRIEKYGHFEYSFIRRTKNSSIRLMDNFEELEQYIKIVEIYPKLIYLFG